MAARMLALYYNHNHLVSCGQDRCGCNADNIFQLLISSTLRLESTVLVKANMWQQLPVLLGINLVID